jgi:hypothetical protein
MVVAWMSDDIVRLVIHGFKREQGKRMMFKTRHSAYGMKEMLKVGEVDSYRYKPGKNPMSTENTAKKSNKKRIETK